MNKCANCDRDALYLYQIGDSFKLYYCQSHLPSFLWESRDLGQLGIPLELPVEEEEAPVETTKSKKKTVEPEPEPEPEVVVEEPVVEESPSEA
jgi:hypothetical protein